MRFSALVTCTTECAVIVEARDAEEARRKMVSGQFEAAYLHDGGLAMCERFLDIDITPESFGADSRPASS